jgi:hypothetical protein
VYAYDADEPPAYVPLWTRSLGRAVPRAAIFKTYLNFAGEVGVTSTPVVQRGDEGGTIFLVGRVSFARSSRAAPRTIATSGKRGGARPHGGATESATENSRPAARDG